MTETLQRTETPRQQAINALRLIQFSDTPKTRDTFPGFLYDNEVTQLLAYVTDTFGRQRQGRENQNNLLYKSIVDGELVPPPGEDADFAFLTVYPKTDRRPATIGLYVKSGPENCFGTGLNLPIDDEANLLWDEFVASPYAQSAERSALALQNGLGRIVSVLEAMPEVEETAEIEPEQLAA